MVTRFEPLKRLLVGCLALLAAGTPLGRAGSGRINPDGTMDFTVNFRYPPTLADITTIQSAITDASRVLWDATEGQLRFGSVTFTSSSVDEDLADIWVMPQSGRSGSAVGSLLGVAGMHVTLFRDDIHKVGTIAHEMCHLAFALGDEYDEQQRFGACWGVGPCIETAAQTDQNQCLMQQMGTMAQTATEFCTASHHDLLRGDGMNCPQDCPENCELWNSQTGRYETSRHHQQRGKSCWEVLVERLAPIIPGFSAPSSLPEAASPADPPDPTFTDNTFAADVVVLVLDRSGSMRWDPNSDQLPTGTTEPRLSFVKAAARGWLALAENQGVRAGIVSFNQDATTDEAIQDVTTANRPALNAAVDALSASGSTSIGAGLGATLPMFAAEPTAGTRTAFLISDGQNTSPPEPDEIIPDLVAEGIHVRTISTGDASDHDQLITISEDTGGETLDSPSATTLVNAFARQWARYRGLGTLIPQTNYTSDATNILWVEPFTTKLSLMLAGNMAPMTNFGPHIIVSGPPGPNPSLFDSAVPHPLMRVVNDSFFQLIEIDDPNPGIWHVQHLRGGQTGNLTVLVDNPFTRLFIDLSRSVTTQNHPTAVRLSVEPIFYTALRNVDSLVASVKRPDGTVVPLTLTNDLAQGGEGAYYADLSSFPVPGMYEVRVTMQTGPNTYNDPGESIFTNSPPNSVVVPVIERTAFGYVFVRSQGRVALNDTPTTATPLVAGNGSSHAAGLSSGASRVDYYQFVAPTNAQAWITVDTGGSPVPPPTTRDSLLTLLAADGMTVLEADDNDGSGNGGNSTLETGLASAIAGRRLTNAGPYYLRVEPAGTNEAIMPYQLFLDITTNTPVPEMESNNSVGTANPLVTPTSPRGVCSGALNTTNDLDYYSITGDFDTSLHVSVDADPERDGTVTDVVVELLNSNGSNLLFSANSSGSAPASAEGFWYQINSTNSFYVRVRGSQGAQGTYQLMVARRNPSTAIVRITTIRLINEDLFVSFPTAVGKRYSVQGASQLGGQWSTFGVVEGSGGIETYFVSHFNLPQYFYRVIEH